MRGAGRRTTRTIFDTEGTEAVKEHTEEADGDSKCFLTGARRERGRVFILQKVTKALVAFCER